MEQIIGTVSNTATNIALFEVLLAAVLLLVSAVLFLWTYRFYRKEQEKRRWKEAEEAEQRLRGVGKKKTKRPDQFTGGNSYEDADIDDTMVSDEGRGETVVSPREADDDETVVMVREKPAYLEYQEDGVVRRYPVTRDVTRIGRQAEQADLILENRKVGKAHAQLIREKGMYYIQDLNSKNGTYLNGGGRRLEADALFPVHDGDRITLADSELILRCEEKE